MGDESTGILPNGNRKLLALCVAITIAINTPALFVMNEHWVEIQALRKEIREGVKDRYYKTDAENHIAVDEQRFNNIYFRFERNEAGLNECLTHIRGHKHEDD